MHRPDQDVDRPFCSRPCSRPVSRSYKALMRHAQPPASQYIMTLSSQTYLKLVVTGFDPKGHGEVFFLVHTLPPPPVGLSAPRTSIFTACFTGKVFIRHPRTPDRRTHRCNFNIARGPLDPLTTAVLVSRRAGPLFSQAKFSFRHRVFTLLFTNGNDCTHRTEAHRGELTWSWS